MAGGCPGARASGPQIGWLQAGRPRSQSPATRLPGPVAGGTPALPGVRAFTLIELILVMFLLAVVASLVTPRMSSFFRGQALSFEARRLLSLTHYAQSRAAAEGVPVLLWIDPRDATYGLEVQGGSRGAGERLRTFTADPSLTLSAPPAGAPPESELGDETLGAPEGLPVIRFMPDGFLDEISVFRILIQQDAGAGLDLVQKPNRLGYEIRPAESAM
jgi:prepilin-type N-terminal cleavage/methylation domain-containing protein